MYYYIVRENHIVVVGEMDGAFREITENEYNEIRNLLNNKPTSEEPNYDYYLTENLEWDCCEDPVPVIRDDIEDDEALNILLGGAE